MKAKALFGVLLVLAFLAIPWVNLPYNELNWVTYGDSYRPRKKIRVIMKNKVGCGMTLTIRGPGLPRNGKRLEIPQGKKKRLRLQRNATYTWAATALACCSAASGSFHTPNRRRMKLRFRCGPPIGVRDVQVEVVTPQVASEEAH